MTFEHYLKRLSFNDMMDLEPLQRQSLLHQIGFSSSHYAHHNKPMLYRRMKEALLIQPHHLPQLSYLNLPEMWYAVPLGEDITLKLSDNQARDTAIYDLQEYVKIRISGYFYEILTSANHRLPSRFIRSFLGCYRMSGLQEHGVFPTITFISILSHLHRFYYNDSNFISEFLTTVCSTQKMKMLILNSFIQKELVRYILKMCNKARFDLRRFLTSNNPRNQIPYSTPFCPVLDCLFGGKIFHLKLILQHGFEIYNFDLEAKLAMYRDYLPEMNELVQIRLPENCFNDRGFRRKLLLLDTFCLVVERSFHWINHPVDWTECANLLFRSIPDPYITLGELVKLMSYSNSFKVFAASIFLTYLNNFTEIKALQYKPRTLQHLCRCRIRESLRGNFQLPEGIYKLPLPKKMSRYLLLES